MNGRMKSLTLTSAMIVLGTLATSYGFFWAPAAAAAEAKKAQEGISARQQPSIRVEVDLVNLYVSVTDKRSRAIEGLTAADFRVYEDDVEQQIKHFSTDDAPYTIGLVLDRSGSMADMIGDVFQAAVHTVEASKPEDEAFVIVFNHQVKLVRDFTTNRRELNRAVQRERAGGGTALYEAVYTALNRIQKGQYRKKALLVVTDGEDNSSSTTFRELLNFAREQSVIIHVIGMMSDTMRFDPLQADRPSVEKLTRLADATGGRAYFSKTMAECREACRRTAAELRHQYSLGYYSSNLARDGKWRTVRVEVRSQKDPDVMVRTKEGYLAALERKVER